MEVKLKKSRVLIATIRQLGGCPCPRCLAPATQLHKLGLSCDRQQRLLLVRSDASRTCLVADARKLIYDKNYGVDSTAVELLLKLESWVPTAVSVTINLLYYPNQFLFRIFYLTASAHLDLMCLLPSLLTSSTNLNLGRGARF